MIAAYQTGPQGTQLGLTFQAWEMQIIVLAFRNRRSRRLRRHGKAVQTLSVEGCWDFEIEQTMQRPDVAWNFAEDFEHWHSVAQPACPPNTIIAGDWSLQGLPYFSGIGHYRKEIELPEMQAGAWVELSLGEVAVSAQVFVNGQSMGILFAPPYKLDITDAVRPGRNRIHVAVANTLSNYYAQFEELSRAPIYSGGDLPSRRVSGLLGPVRIHLLEAQRKASE